MSDMSESTVSERNAHHWYMRPVLFVSDVHVALRFYIDTLGFKKKWHAGDGQGTVCQADRGGAGLSPDRFEDVRLSADCLPVCRACV
jgi:hypothetical protein